MHAYEITHEIKNRKEESFKREQKLMQELHEKNNTLKDQSRLILQHDNSVQHLRSEKETLKSANASLNQQVTFSTFLFMQKHLKFRLTDTRP